MTKRKKTSKQLQTEKELTPVWLDDVQKIGALRKDALLRATLLIEFYNWTNTNVH